MPVLNKTILNFYLIVNILNLLIMMLISYIIISM